jgi:riboflavin kinase/FMN adenylyltransferase
MNIIHAASELNADGREVSLAIGFFDGVHLGHQRILQHTAADARPGRGLALAVTFDRHPNAVVAPGRVPPLIYSLPQKLRTLAAQGMEASLVLHFDKPLSEQPGETFIRNLARDLGRIRSICVGDDFTFGHRRDGHVALLKRLGQELGFAVQGMEAVLMEGQVVRSTRIREAIASGDLLRASRMLGRPYATAGIVLRGDQLGRRLGFPTANLDASGLVLPPNGVYAAHALWHGTIHLAAVNIGVRPTFNQPAPARRVEAHLLDFEGDLYGQEIELEFVEKVRDEAAFASLDALKAQIARDVATVRARLQR